MDEAGRELRSEKQRRALTARIVALDHRRLLYLHEACASGSIRAAAERLATSPSALSRQIMRIEAELQTSLLERHGRGVRPTEAGAVLVTYFAAQQAALRDAVAEIHDMQQLRRGLVSLAVGEGFLSDLMGHPLRGFVEAHPQVQIDFHLGSTDELVGRVLEDVSHIGLLFNPPREPRIQSHAMRRHPLCVIAHPRHPLASLDRSLRIEDLEGHDLALLPVAYGVRQVLLSAEQDRRVRLRPRFMANSSRVLLRFAEEWNGVVLAPAFSVAQELQTGRLVALQLENPLVESAEAHLITRRGRRLPAAAGSLLRHLRATLRVFRA